MSRALTIGAALLCLSTGLGSACRSPSSQASIIFDEVPTTIEAPVVVEVTIAEMSKVADPATGPGWLVMNARIDRVIKGPIDIGPLKIVTENWGCTTGFGAGSHGIVIGILRYDAQGTLGLVAVQESHAERGVRKAREQGK